ncbi:MAG: PhnD/SsuA/transferrin family substrate-binding protein [Planctomycetia bacterium]|nr:PhnD/SsuA/transferrin family substrate-binding protein [Planctomycetia bacterium]
MHFRAAQPTDRGIAAPRRWLSQWQTKAHPCWVLAIAVLAAAPHIDARGAAPKAPSEAKADAKPIAVWAQPGEADTVNPFPDQNASYWSYRFAHPVGENFGLRIRGHFPHARFMGFAIYDQESMIAGDSLVDSEIEPDRGSKNPFAPGADRNARARAYTAWLVPHDRHRTPDGSANLVHIPPPEPGQRAQSLELWYRVYLPDARFVDDPAGVALPTIEAVDLKTGEAVACPPSRSLRNWIGGALCNIPPTRGDGRLEFYRSEGKATFANPDNRYIVARLDFTRQPIVVIRFKAPRYTDTCREPDKPLSDEDEVRYWSMSLGGISMRTSASLADTSAIVDESGWVTVVVGPESMAEEVAARGLNFLPRGRLLVPFLIYRNMLPRNFAGSHDKVPIWPPARRSSIEEPSVIAAQHFIGDYAPQGRYYGRDEFLAAFPVGKMPATDRGRARLAPIAATVDRALVVPAESVRPDRDPDGKPHVTIGLSWSFLFGAVWPQTVGEVAEADGAIERSVSFVSHLEEDVARFVEERCRLSCDVRLLPLDSLVEQLDAGRLQFALVCGHDYDWVAKNAKGAAPLVYGNLATPVEAEVKAHLVVRRELLTRLGATAGDGRLTDLKGLVLAASRVPSYCLYFLENALVEEQCTPQAFFRRPLRACGTADAALDAVARGGIAKRAKTADELSADVALVSSAVLARYMREKPDRWQQLAVYASSPPMPAPVLICDPAKVNRDVADLVARGLVEGRAQRASLRNLNRYMRIVLGLSAFSAITPEYRALVERRERGGAKYPAYGLPLFFY